MPRWLRPCVASVTLLISVVLARKIGLIDLIANGYGNLTWAFLVLYLLPLLTLGVYKIVRGGDPQT